MNRNARNTSLNSLPVPGRWSTPLMLRTFRLAPWRFFAIGILDLTQRFLNMAAFLIPIKLLFLASTGNSELPIPGLNETLSLGQFEVTMLILPISILPTIGVVLGKIQERMKKTLIARLEDVPSLDPKLKPRIRQLIMIFAAGFNMTLLGITCFFLMAAIIPEISAGLGTVVAIAVLVTRYRIKRYYRRNEVDDGEPDDAATASDQLNKVRQISDSTLAVAQVAILPLFVYLLSGAIINQTVDAIFAIAFLFLFRMFSSGAQGSTRQFSRLLHILQDSSALQSLVISGRLDAAASAQASAKG